jgi:hypothetical protein
MNKKIIIVSRSFYPENSPRSFRTTELVKEFSRQGHDVTLYTIKDNPLHADFEKEYKVTIKDIGKLKFNTINFENKNQIIGTILRIIRRLLLMLFEFPDIELMFKVKKALKNISGYDLLISIAVPHPIHWGVAWAWNNKKPIAKVWAADCGDPFMGAEFDSFKKLFYFKYFEKWFCKKATFIPITNIKMINNYYPEFHHKIIEIPQGFNFGDIKIYEGEIKNSVPTFAFAGLFIPTSRNPTALLKYLSTLTIDFKFVIYPKNTELIEPFKKILGHKLEIRGLIPRQQLIYELSKMDFLVNIGFDPTNQSPSKLIDYALTKRPILSLQSNEVKEKVLSEFFEKKYHNQFVVENIDQYKIENVCQKFLDLLKNK